MKAIALLLVVGVFVFGVPWMAVRELTRFDSVAADPRPTTGVVTSAYETRRYAVLRTYTIAMDYDVDGELLHSSLDVDADLYASLTSGDGRFTAVYAGSDPSLVVPDGYSIGRGWKYAQIVGGPVFGILFVWGSFRRRSQG